MRTEPRIVSLANEIPHIDGRYCTCCERALKNKVAWLELDQRTNTYHDFGDVPADKSQGWFPFGPACARRLLREAKAEEFAVMSTPAEQGA